LPIARILLHGAAPVAALALLNASVTFYDVWPTPGVEWHGHLSMELAVAVLMLVAAVRVGGERTLAWLTRGLAALWIGLVGARYFEVMAPALYGRPVNLYWDVRHLGAVTAMMTDAVAGPVLLLVVAGIVLALALVYIAARWAFRAIAVTSRRPAGGWALAVAAILVVGQFVAQTIAGHHLPPLAVAPPVTASYWHQARLLVEQMRSAPPSLAASNATPASDLGGVRGADVLLVFLESYGAVTLDRPAVAEPIAKARASFAADVAATRRRVVSAMVDSPTFGGASWLAHISLMTGVEARDEGTSIALMSHRRDTLVSTFAQAGYRTVALMPGLRHPWPEGAFYGFDTIYDTASLGYTGPQFGWWIVPDQFALARLDDLEAARAATRPLFLFFPTTSTHAPFGPVAPYQPDWARLMSDHPYAEPDVQQALARVPDYFDLAPSYVHAITYSLATVGGYLRRHPTRDLVVVLVGDHQPAAAVTGEGASWDVPVHVVASRSGVLDLLVSRGFHDGITPGRRAIGPMHGLLSTLLTAFGGSPGPAAPARPGQVPTGAN
jgi:hypothetical protein